MKGTKLGDILPLIDENSVVVILADGKEAARYDGRDSIPEYYSSFDVTKIATAKNYAGCITDVIPCALVIEIDGKDVYKLESYDDFKTVITKELSLLKSEAISFDSIAGRWDADYQPGYPFASDYDMRFSYDWSRDKGIISSKSGATKSYGSIGDWVDAIREYVKEQSQPVGGRKG